MNGNPVARCRRGRVAHLGMLWPHLTGKYYGGGQPGRWDGDPEEGILPAALVPMLAAVPGGHTAGEA